MSVPVWKRKLSGAEYIYQVYKLNIRLGEILANKPKKYRNNYSDEIIKTALSALKHLQIVDDIFLTKWSSKQDYEIRHEHLHIARGEINNIATACYIFLEIVRAHDSEKYDKIYDEELEIGEMCEDCFELITGVIKSDKETYKKYINPKG